MHRLSRPIRAIDDLTSRVRRCPARTIVIYVTYTRPDAAEGYRLSALPISIVLRAFFRRRDYRTSGSLSVAEFFFPLPPPELPHVFEFVYSSVLPSSLRVSDNLCISGVSARFLRRSLHHSFASCFSLRHTTRIRSAIRSIIVRSVLNVGIVRTIQNHFSFDRFNTREPIH